MLPQATCSTCVTCLSCTPLYCGVPQWHYRIEIISMCGKKGKKIYPTCSDLYTCVQTLRANFFLFLIAVCQFNLSFGWSFNFYLGLPFVRRRVEGCLKGGLQSLNSLHSRRRSNHVFAGSWVSEQTLVSSNIFILRVREEREVDLMKKGRTNWPPSLSPNNLRVRVGYISLVVIEGRVFKWTYCWLELNKDPPDRVNMLFSKDWI